MKVNPTGTSAPGIDRYVGLRYPVDERPDVLMRPFKGKRTPVFGD